jgi:hypothetical protein
VVSSINCLNQDHLLQGLSSLTAACVLVPVQCQACSEGVMTHHTYMFVCVKVCGVAEHSSDGAALTLKTRSA